MYNNTPDNAGQHATDATEIAPNDSTDLAKNARAIHIGGAGTMRVTTLAGNVVNFTGLLAGQWYSIGAKRIHSTGTTATGIVALH